MKLLVATTNVHKIDEVRSILAPHGIEVVGLADLPGAADLDEPVEDGDTFAANARTKAVYYARAIGSPCIADDSGLVVDALDGAPGVHSARYADASGPRAERDLANNARLLRELADVPPAKRTARFVCAMCLVDADGNVQTETEGTFDGVVTLAPAGTNGFGYDPLLYLPDVGCTSAELSPPEKNARSHRGKAARAIARWLVEHVDAPGERRIEK